MNKLVLRYAVAAGFLAIFGLLGPPSPVHAAILLPGTSAAPDIFATAPTGSVVAFLPAQPVSTLGGDKATLITAVVQDTPGGTLNFLYQWTADAGNPDNFSLNSAIFFSGFTTDVGYINNAAALPASLTGIGFTAGSGGTLPVPSSVSRTSGVGSTVDWLYPTGVSANFNPGDRTVILEVKTNALFYTSGFTGIQNGTTANANSFSPAVPEPMSIVIWVVGSMIAGVVIVRSRRRQVA